MDPIPFGYSNLPGMDPIPFGYSNLPGMDLIPFGYSNLPGMDPIPFIRIFQKRPFHSQTGNFLPGNINIIN